MRKNKNFTLQNYYNKCIENVTLDFKTMRLDTRDPHIDYLIKSFALIDADLKYNLEYKVDQTFRHILLNVFYDIFGIIPSVGILKIDSQRTLYIKNKSVLSSDNSSIFTTKFNIQLHNTKLMDYKISFDPLVQQYYLHIELNGSFEGDLYFHGNLNLINSIFESNNSVSCDYTVRTYKETSECILIEQNNLKSFCWFPDQFCFFTIKMNVIDKTIISIPLHRPCEAILNINCVPVENNFLNSSVIYVKNSGYYDLIANNNEKIFKVNNIMDGNNEINHVRDGNGWFFLDNEEFSLYFQEDFSQTKALLVNYSSYNKEVSINNMDFQEFLPVKISWLKNPLPVKEIDSYNVHIQLLKCLFLQQQQTSDHFELIKSMMNIFSYTLDLNDSFTDIKLEETVKPIIKKINNTTFTMCKMGVECTMKYSGNNYLLLYQITNELQKYNENFIKFNIIMQEKTFYR